MWQNSLYWVGVGTFVSWASAKNETKSIGIQVLVLRKTKLIWPFCIFISYYCPCNKNVGFWDVTLLFLDDTCNLIISYVPNKVTKVLFHTRNLCKAAGKIVAVSARWKTRGQGPGTGYGESGKRGVWKTWDVDNTGVWKTRSVGKKQKQKQCL